MGGVKRGDRVGEWESGRSEEGEGEGQGWGMGEWEE